MLPSQQSAPLYVLPKKKVRAIVPKVVSLFMLGAVFYVGILLNVALLDLKAAEEGTVKLVALIVVLLVVIMGSVLSILRARNPYKFYRDRVMTGKKTVLYSSITDLEKKRNIYDKLFKTYSLKLTKKLSLHSIAWDVDVEDYMKKLTAYARVSSKVNIS
jgi:hypothetical protein